MADDVIDAGDARTALDAAATSRRRLLERAGPVSLATQLTAAPMLLVASAAYDQRHPSDVWWAVGYGAAVAVLGVNVLLERRRKVRVTWGSAGPAGWVLMFGLMITCAGAWYLTVAVLERQSLPSPYTWAGVAMIVLLLAVRPALNRAFRWLALRRDVG